MKKGWGSPHPFNIFCIVFCYLIISVISLEEVPYIIYQI